MITDLSQLDPKGTYTYADYLQWQFDETVELIRGKIYQMSPAPKRVQQDVSGNLAFALRTHFDDVGCKVYEAPFDVRMPVGNENKPHQIHTVVQPDICVVCDLEKLDDDGCLGAPDWVIEITSPRTIKKDFNEKFNLYEAAGVREYWIVVPKEKTVNVYALQGEYEQVGVYESGEIPNSVFPDLRIQHERIFR